MSDDFPEKYPAKNVLDASYLLDVITCDTMEKRFIWAAYTRDMKQFSLCLEQGVDPNTLCPGTQTTALHLLAERGDLSLGIRLLMENDVQKELRDEEGYTPLHLACFFGKKKFVKLLLRNDVDVNSLDGANRTGLLLAVKMDHISVVIVLIKNKADVNLADTYGGSPLSVAATRTRNYGMTKLLVGSGADLEYQLGRNLPVFLDCVLHCQNSNDLDIILMFMNFTDRFDINMTDRQNRNCLHYAVLTGYLDLVMVLLMNGADPALCDRTGRSPADLAKEFNTDEEIQILLEDVSKDGRRRSE